MISIVLEDIYTLFIIYHRDNEPKYVRKIIIFAWPGFIALLFLVILRYGRSTCFRTCK